MARKPKAPEQENTPAVPDADILPESQQPEQTEAPPFEPNTQPPEMAAEEDAKQQVAVRDGGEITKHHSKGHER